ncbi:MAG: carboxymuconolactone decarboxylase family protein [Chloroflexi bacterium]|nr:carboxymuconolactone decarboxylase family protein [Chloroflexota bacterium]
MDRRTLARLLNESEEERQRTAAAVLALIRAKQGEPPYVLQTLAQRRPDLLLAQGFRALTRRRALEPRVAELIAMASAAALRCEWCIRTHLDAARRAGAGEDETFEALAIAAAIAESSTQAVAFREFDAAMSREVGRPGRRRRAAPTVEATPEEERPTRRRRGTAAPAPTYPSREAFWNALAERFQQTVSRARLSRSTNPYWRAVRLGRGKIQLTWAFRRRGNLAVQMLLDGAAGGPPQREALRDAAAAMLGQEVVLEAGRGRRAAVAAYYPVRGAGTTEGALTWGIDTMARLYQVLSLVEGRRRRRGRRPRGPEPESPQGRCLAALQPYLPAPRVATRTRGTPASL